MPKIFWSYAVIHSVYLINRLPTPLLNNKSPYEILYTTLPDIHDLKVFGALCFASTLTAHRSKFDSRAKKCLFLGYKSGTKGYILFDLSTREIFISRHVIFYESIFPYKSQSSSHFSTSPISLPLDTTLSDYDFLFSPSSLLNSSSSTLPSQHVSPSSTAQTEPRHSNRTRKPPSYLL